MVRDIYAFSSQDLYAVKGAESVFDLMRTCHTQLYVLKRTVLPVHIEIGAEGIAFYIFYYVGDLCFGNIIERSIELRRFIYADLPGLFVLYEGRGRNSLLEDAGLVGRDLGKSIAQNGHMVEVYRCDDGRQRLFYHVSGIADTAEACLQYYEIYLLSREVHETDRGDDLKLCRGIVAFSDHFLSLFVHDLRVSYQILL